MAWMTAGDAIVVGVASVVFAKVPGLVMDTGVIAGVIVSVSAAATVVTKLVLSAIKKATAELDDKIEEHIGPLADSFKKHKRHSEDEFKFIRSELSYNSGKTVKDLVKKNNDDLVSIRDEVDTIKKATTGGTDK